MSNLESFTDDELTQLLRKSDESAFTYIYNHYWDKLYYVAYRLLRDTDAAEEIVQEVFMALWKKRETLSIQSMNPYLGAMTRYAVYRFLAKQKLSKTKENDVAMENSGAVSEIDVENKILLEIVTRLSNKLPEKCRLVFQYNKLEDQSLPEVAERLNMSQKTAEAHLTKALRVVRSGMSDVTRDYMPLIIIIALLKK